MNQLAIAAAAALLAACGPTSGPPDPGAGDDDFCDQLQQGSLEVAAEFVCPTIP